MKRTLSMLAGTTLLTLTLAACSQQSAAPDQGAGAGSAQAATPPILEEQGQRFAPVDCGFLDGRGRCFAYRRVNPEGITIAAATPSGYTPTQIRHAYGFDQVNNQGAGQTIAIVDAYNAPNIRSDLQTFKNQFGITGCNLTVVNQSGGSTLPKNDGGWAQETSLDVEWACAIAPGANLLLVEANTPSDDLYTAVNYARQHASVVSMSFGGDESGATSYDSYFNHPGVSFVASSGDDGNGASYPATSPYVLAVGGTTLKLTSANVRSRESTWSGSGGGISTAESEPGYQSGYAIPSTGNRRGSPDVSYDSDPATGFPVYDSYAYQGASGWMQFGGTSDAAPQISAAIAIVDSLRGSPITTASSSTSPFYNAAKSSYAANYFDVKTGSNGSCGSVCSAATGYDFTTGLGTPRMNAWIPWLQSH